MAIDAVSTPTPDSGAMKPTLSLTGITVNAMALIAPGAFLWTTFAAQSAQTRSGNTTAHAMWLGLLSSLVLAFLTAYSYSELANLYPQAGTGSSYYFAEAALLDKEKKSHFQYARIAKVTVGWISHLYYWIYPGIMAAFAGYLFQYIGGLAGWGLASDFKTVAAVVIIFTALNAYVAFRGVSGSTMAAIFINAIQITALLAFSIWAIAYRLTHGDGNYENHSLVDIFGGGGSFADVYYQGTIAILLLVGFESVTSLGAEAKNPKRDIRRGILLSLAIQGGIMYLFEYTAANLVVGVNSFGGATGYAGAANSSAPIADMVTGMLSGQTGNAIALIISATVLIALFGTMLACLNTGVRITYAMGRDKEMPSILGLLHGRFATPHMGVWILAAISAALGVYACTDLDHLLIITVASNFGTFLVYGMTNLIALVAFWSHHERGFIKHTLVPVVGFLANLAMLFGVLYIAINAGDTGLPGGNTASDAKKSLIIFVAWAVLGIVWFVANTARLRRPAMIAAKTGSAAA